MALTEVVRSGKATADGNPCTAICTGRFATIQQYAEQRQFHVATVRRWLKEGMPHIGKGRSIRIVVPEADTWLTERTTHQTKAAEAEGAVP